jgi:ribosomal protein S14
MEEWRNSLEKRTALLKIMRDRTDGATVSSRMRAHAQLAKKFSVNASPVRHRLVCPFTKRARSIYQDFGIGRMYLRKNALLGFVPGVVKGSL